MLGVVRVDGATVAVDLQDTPAGKQTLARVILPAGLAPGGTVVLDADFSTRIPKRFGSFGCVKHRCRLMGGFYPMTAHLAVDGWRLQTSPDRVDVTTTVSAPPGVDLVINGAPAASVSSPATSQVWNAPYATLIADRGLHRSTRQVAGFSLVYLHSQPRPPPSDREALPYIREDIPGLVLATAASALTLLAEQGLRPAAISPPPPHTPPATLVLVEAPLRHQLVQVHGSVVMVSDEIFRIFPVDRLRKFHRFELARAVMTAALEAALRKVEPDRDLELSAQTLAGHLMEVYTVREFQQIEYARDLLRPFAFIPAVDQLIYAPLVANSSSYFGDVGEADPVRDDVRRFSHREPGGRFIHQKLTDMLGPAGMVAVAHKVLAEGVPLRAAAERVFGSGLDWFWAQWLGPPPRVNYRLAGIRVEERRPGAAVRVAIDVERQGDDVVEPVEVRVTDRAGGIHNLVWRERGARHRFEVDLPAALRSVEVDPRGRLVESAVGTLLPYDDPRHDNRSPPRWRLLYSGFNGLLNITEVTAAFIAAFTLKRTHDLRHLWSFSLRHSASVTLGFTAGYWRLFGTQADKNRLTSSVGGSLFVLRLDPSFGAALDQVPQPGWRVGVGLGADHDDRGYFIDPWRAVGLDVGVGYSLTALERGTELSHVSVGAEVLRLFELLPGHVLALALKAGATFGQIRLASQLARAGGPGALRGYGEDELLGRAMSVGRLELRNQYVTDLAWNLLHFTTVRTLAGSLFVDAAAISGCGDYHFSREAVFFDAGYSFRVLHDAFGVYQQLLSIDLAIPLNRKPRDCLGAAIPTSARPPFTILVTFLPNF
jgi:hypothetical protein